MAAVVVLICGTANGSVGSCSGVAGSAAVGGKENKRMVAGAGGWLLPQWRSPS